MITSEQTLARIGRLMKVSTKHVRWLMADG